MPASLISADDETAGLERWVISVISGNNAFHYSLFRGTSFAESDLLTSSPNAVRIFLTGFKLSGKAIWLLSCLS